MVLLLLGWKVPRLVVPARTEDDNPTIELTLVSPDHLRTVPPATAKARVAASVHREAARVLSAPAPAAPVSTAPQSSPAPVPPNLETSPDNDHIRNALRGLIGCSAATAYRLTREERETCDRQLAAAKPAPVGPPYTPAEVAAFNGDKKESILTRKPVNDCLPRLGDHAREGPAGAQGMAQSSGGRSHSRAATTAVGVGCGWSF